MSEYNFLLSKSIKGSLPAFKATFYENWNDKKHTQGDSQLTGLEIPGRPLIEGMEKQLDLQPITNKKERVWVGDKVIFTGEDEEENKIDIAVVKKIILKTIEEEAMAWMQLGEKGEDVRATENWKD